LTIINAAGIACLAGWPASRLRPHVRYFDWRKLCPLLLVFVLWVLVDINLLLYLPICLGGMVALYNLTRSNQAPFRTPAAQAVTPALVIDHAARWME
jgi:hypothetical protein